MTMLGRAYAWALRRVFAFALRRALGEALLDLDADQLDVALRSGTFEIRDAALRGSYLRRELGDVVPVTCLEGRVARLRAVIPWHALGAEPIAVELESLDLVVGPNPDFFTREKEKAETSPTKTGPSFERPNARTPPNNAAERCRGDAVAAVRDATRAAVRGMTVRATNVRVRFRADLRLSNGASATRETPPDEPPPPFSDEENIKDERRDLADALLRVDEIAFGNLDTFQVTGVECSDDGDERSSDPLRDAKAWDAKARDLKTPTENEALENDDGSDRNPRGIRAGNRRGARERRARARGVVFAVAGDARAADGGEKLGGGFADPSWRVVLDSGDACGAGVDATFGVRGPERARRTKSGERSEAFFREAFFGLDSDALVDVDPRTLARVAALARAFGAPTPRATGRDEVEDAPRGEAMREPERLAEAFEEVLSASRASFAAEASSFSADDGSSESELDSDDSDDSDGSDGSDDVFFDAESEPREGSTAGVATTPTAVWVGSLHFAAPSLALRARWRDAEEDDAEDDETPGDDFVVVAVRGVRASIAADMESRIVSVTGSLDAAEVREEALRTPESDRAEAALAALPFAFRDDFFFRARKENAEKESREARGARRSAVAAAAPDGARFAARGSFGASLNDTDDRSDFGARFDVSFTALGAGVVARLDTALVGRLATLLSALESSPSFRKPEPGLEPSEPPSSPPGAPMKPSGPSGPSGLFARTHVRLALETPRARLAVVARHAGGGVSCAAVDARRTAAEAHSAGSQTFSSGRLHGSDGSGEDPDRSTTADVSVDAADAYLAHLEGENDSLRNKDEKVKWWHVARLEGVPDEGDGDDETDGRTERARASRACRRVTLSARLSSKHAPSSSRRSDTSQPLFGRDVERDATTLARRALALVRGGDGASGSGESSSSRAHATPGRFSSARRASDGNAMESLDEPLLSEASRSLRAEALAEASLETHVEAGVVRLLASGAAAHAASALSRALAALPETHPMRVAAPPPGAAVPPAAVSLRAAQMLVAFQEGLISETPLKKPAALKKPLKKGAVVLTLRDAEAFFAASLAGAQHADHAFVAARAGALTHAGGDAAIVGLLTHTDSFPGAADHLDHLASPPGIVVAYARVPPDAGTNERPNEKESPSRDRSRATRRKREPGASHGSAFAAIVTGGAARVSASREAGDDSEGSVGENAKTKTDDDDDDDDADVRRAVDEIAAAFADAAPERTAGPSGSGPSAAAEAAASPRDAFSSRVELRRVSLALSSRLTRLDPGHRDAASDPGPEKTSLPQEARRRERALEHRRGVVLMDALRVAFAEEEDAVGGENTNANRPSRRRQTLSARCLNASAHVARPVVEGDDSDVIDVVPATARAARDAGYARVVSVDALAVDRESFLVTPNADGDANASSSSREAETTETTRVSARLGSLRCAFRRDTLDAAAALARRFRRVDGSPSRASPPPRAAFCSSAPTAGTKPDRHAEAVGRPSGIRVRLDRVDPEAFAFAVNRSTPSPRAVVSDTAALVSPRVIDDYYGPERDFSLQKKVFFLSEKTPNAPERKTRKTADRVSVVGGVTFSPSFAAPAVSARELGPASFAKPASVRRAAARTVRASFANARASARSGTEYLENEKNSTPSSHRGTLKLRASGPAVESSMPTARWFDGAAPVATDAVHDAPTSGARREPRRSLRGGPKTDDAFQKAFHDASQNASDAFRVPEASLEPLCAEGDRERTLTSAIEIEVANATLAIRPGLEWDNKKSGEKPKDDDCDGVRAAAADISLRADAFGDAANPTNPTTRLRRRTSPFPDDDEERFSYDDDAHMAVSRLVTATVGDAAVFTRAAAQNAPTATLLAHDAGAGGEPRQSGAGGALARARLTESRCRTSQKLPEASGTAERPNAGADASVSQSEFALRVVCLPLRARLDRRAAAFLAAFFDASGDENDADARRERDGQERNVLLHEKKRSSVLDVLDENAYFREVDVRLPRVRLDHAVRGLDPAAALDALRGGARAGESAERAGAGKADAKKNKKNGQRGVSAAFALALEMSNLLPLRGVSLNLETAVPGGTVRGVRGLSAASAQIARNWLEHIARTQTHEFVRGFAPARSAENVAEGARAFAEGAARAAAALVDGAYGGQARLPRGAERRRGLAPPRDADAGQGAASSAWRAAAAGAATLARALSVEALGVAAGVAAGATAVLETADDALAERFFAERDERDERNDRAFSGRPERTHGTGRCLRVENGASTRRDDSDDSDDSSFNRKSPNVSARAMAKAASRASDAAPHPADAREGARRAAASLRRGLGVAVAAARDIGRDVGAARDGLSAKTSKTSGVAALLPSAALASTALTVAAARAARDVARGAKRSMARASVPGFPDVRAASKHRSSSAARSALREGSSGKKSATARLAALAFESDADDAWVDDLDDDSDDFFDDDGDDDDASKSDASESRLSR